MNAGSSETPNIRGRQWLSVSEVAEELGMSQMTLYRLIDRGEFPAVRFGRRLTIPARVLEELAAAALARGCTVHAAEWRGGAA